MQAIKIVFISGMLFSFSQTFPVVISFDNAYVGETIDIEIYTASKKTPFTNISIEAGMNRYVKISDALFYKSSDTVRGVNAKIVGKGKKRE